jgi:RHS repeat-associated protein
VLVTDEAGQQIYSSEYTPFGKQVSKEGELDHVTKFTGKDLDEDTGLYYFNARWYDQEIGRFITEDTIAIDPNDPSSLNLYLYGRNNPLRFTDPTGNTTEDNTDDNNKETIEVITEAANTAYEQRTVDSEDPFRLFKDMGVFVKELFKSWNKHAAEKEAQEQKQRIEIAKALLEIDGVSQDDPDYTKKLQAQISELSLAAMMEKNPPTNYISGGVVVKGAKAAPGLFRKLFPKITDKIDDIMGKYDDVGGHHVHAKAAFRDAVKYDPDKGFSISQEFMEKMGWRHTKMTSAQRQLFKELAQSGKPNTLAEHSKIAMKALQAAGATKEQARYLVQKSLKNLASQGVSIPTNIPWN